MKINLKLTLTLLLMAIMPAVAISAADPALVSGKLPNGLAYYIYRNTDPAGRADFFLTRSVGSIVENENERGLAHFLEHLAFNGTEHFPGNSLISWLESVGVKFGENLNAYTSIDETVYNICKVPVARESVVDSCLLVLRDWSCGLTLNDDDIEAERGVIKGEWRHRNGASNRLLQKAAPRIYGDSPYGRRMPMGLMEVVENCPPQLLRDFYRRNYTPDTEAVIVVGDIDPVAIQEKIVSVFSGIEGRLGSGIVDRSVAYGLPLTAIAESDPEQPTEMVQLFFKHPAVKSPGTEEKVRSQIVSSILTSMLVERFDRLELREASSVTDIGIGDTKFLLSEPMRALLVRGNAMPGKVTEAVKDLYYEIRRARELGFDQAEFSHAVDEQKREAANDLERQRSRTSTKIARTISGCYLRGEELSTPQEIYDMRMSVLDAISKEDIENYLRSIVNTDGRDVLILHYTKMPEYTGDRAEKNLCDAFAEVNTRPLEAYSPELPVLELGFTEPVAGDIVTSDPDGIFSTEVLSLSNGIKVYLRKSSDKPGQIYLRGIGTGGLSCNYSEADAPSLKLFNDAVAVSGVGDMSNSDLRRYLHGKDMKVAAMASNTEETIEFSTTRGLLEDAFRLMYLKVTDTRPDTTAFRTLISSKKTQLANRKNNPVQAMGDSITRNVYSRHPLGALPTADMLSRVDYGKIMDVFHDRFKDFSDFRFYIAGDFDSDSVKNLVKRYVASLPAGGRIERSRDIGYRFSPTMDVEFSRPMQTPVSVVYQFRHAPEAYSLQNVVFASAVGQLLKARLLRVLREEKGWTYSLTTHGSVTAGMNGDDPSEFMMPVYVKVDPAHTAQAASVIDSVLDEMASGRIEDEEVEKVKEYMLKNIADNRQDNAYWLLALRQHDRHGMDMDSGYEQCVGNLNPSSLSGFLKPLLKSSSVLRITMTPEG